MPKFAFGEKKPSKEVQEGLKDVKESHDSAIESARLLLHSDGFQKFIEEYREAERKTIDILMKYSAEEADPLRFGLIAKDLLSKIVNIRSLLKSVHGKAGEKYA